MNRCLVLVEGQTEEAFINSVLTPHLTLGSGFTDVLADASAIVTTMIDYYALPADALEQSSAD